MARDIYSFVKIEKKQTKRGVYAVTAGICSMICLLILGIIAFISGGALPAAAGGIGYMSFIVAAAALWVSVKLRQDSEAYGKMVHSAFYVNIVAVMLHSLIFIIGFFSILI